MPGVNRHTGLLMYVWRDSWNSDIRIEKN